MTGLVIKLKPNEKVLVNGVILQNGDRAASIRVRSNNVSILRARDAIQKEEANTPLKRIYYVAQLAMAGEAEPPAAANEIQQGIEPLMPIFAGDALSELNRAYLAAKEEKFFVVMRAVKKLFPLEDALLKRDPAPALAS